MRYITIMDWSLVGKVTQVNKTESDKKSTISLYCSLKDAQLTTWYSWIHSPNPVTHNQNHCLLKYFSWRSSAWGCTDFILTRCQSDAKQKVHRRLPPSRHGEGEVLHEGREEEEKLHLGKCLPWTQPLTWDRNGKLSFLCV